MASRGRPPKTWEQLKARGAKKCVWEKRRLQELAAADPGQVKAVKEFIQRMKEEKTSWQSRRIDGQTVTPCDQEPKIFEEIKSFCQRMITTNSSPLCRRFAVRFMRDLKSAAGRGYYFDCQAVENVDVWLYTFGVPGSEYLDSDLFVLGNVVGWKRPDGSYRFKKRWAELSSEQGHVIAKGLKVLARS